MELYASLRITNSHKNFQVSALQLAIRLLCVDTSNMAAWYSMTSLHPMYSLFSLQQISKMNPDDGVRQISRLLLLSSGTVYSMFIHRALHYSSYWRVLVLEQNLICFPAVSALKTLTAEHNILYRNATEQT